MNSCSNLLIFIKNPILGKVKTRLANEIGDAAALSIYFKLLTHTKNISLKVSCNRLLFYSDFIDTSDSWSQNDYVKYEQEGEDLGQRISNAFKIGFKSCDKNVIIGSDCFELFDSQITIAFEYLDSCDLVIGPAHDGGYYLLGIKMLQPELFNGIQWSSEKVLDQTIEKAKKLGLKLKLLESLRDVDYAADLPPDYL